MDKEATGIIGRYYEDGFPVILKFVNELPSIEVQNLFPLLTVISWKYDGDLNNGMPKDEINQQMIILEDALIEAMNITKSFVHAFSRTGNNLKEFVYYCKGLDSFMLLLNETLQNHEPYPISIDFYDEPDWNEFKKLLDDFKEK